MGNERGATYQAKVSVCHYFCMENGIMSEKGQRDALRQSCDIMKHGRHPERSGRPERARSSGSGPPEDEQRAFNPSEHT